MWSSEADWKPSALLKIFLNYIQGWTDSILVWLSTKNKLCQRKRGVIVSALPWFYFRGKEHDNKKYKSRKCHCQKYTQISIKVLYFVLHYLLFLNGKKWGNILVFTLNSTNITTQMHQPCWKHPKSESCQMLQTPSWLLVQCLNEKSFATSFKYWLNYRRKQYVNTGKINM